MKTTLLEANLIDLHDEALKEFLGHSFESLKRLEEAKKNDPDIAQMRQKLKDYVTDNYDDEIKRTKANLKAARSLAKARGIEWRLPET